MEERGKEIIMAFFKQPKSFIKLSILLSWILFIGNYLVLSRQISPFSFTPDELCEFSTICEDTCNEYGFPMVEAGQPIPTMFHICVDDLCFCSTQPDDQIKYAWTQGRAIAKFNCDKVLPSEEGEIYDYNKCLTQCFDDYQMSPIDPSDDTIQDDTELTFIIVVNGNCYCGATPDFTTEFAVVPDENEEGLEELQEHNQGSEEWPVYDPNDFNDEESTEEWPVYDPQAYMSRDPDREDDDQVINQSKQPDEEYVGKGKGRSKVMYDSSPPSLPSLTVNTHKHVYNDNYPLIGSSNYAKRVKYSDDKVQEETQNQLQSPGSDNENEA